MRHLGFAPGSGEFPKIRFLDVAVIVTAGFHWPCMKRLHDGSPADSRSAIFAIVVIPLLFLGAALLS
jgi:hypothetical protein